MAEVQQPEQKTIVDKVSEIPVVATAYDYATQYYTKAKEYNNLVKVTLDTAEKSIKYAAETAKPVVQKFEKPINYADQVLVNQLDNLEKKFPIITKAPEEIKKEAQDKYSTTIEPLVKPTVDRVSYVTQVGIETVSNVKQYGVDKVTAVKDYGVDTVTAVKDYGVNKTNELLETKYGQVVATTVTSTVSKTLNVADQYVDYYLPAAEDEEKEDANVDDPMVSRVRKLSGKLRRRVQRVTIHQLEHMQKATQENLAHLNIVLDLLQNAQANLTSTNQAVKDRLAVAQAKVFALWEELNKEEPEDQDQTSKTLEQRSLVLARLVTKRLVNLYNTAASTLHLPKTLQPAITQAQEYATDLYGQVTKISTLEDASNLALTQVRKTGKAVQETVNNLREQALSNVEWLGKDSENSTDEVVNDENSAPNDEE